MLHVKLTLTWKDVLFLHPFFSFGGPESPSFSLLHCQRKPKKWSPRWLTTLLQTWPTNVRVESGRAENMPISWLKVRDVIMVFCRVDLTICLFSRASIMGLRCYPTYCSVWLTAKQWFHIRMTVDECQPMWRVISRNDNPHPRLATILLLVNSDTFLYEFLLII